MECKPWNMPYRQERQDQIFALLMVRIIERDLFVLSKETGQFVPVHHRRGRSFRRRFPVQDEGDDGKVQARVEWDEDQGA